LRSSLEAYDPQTGEERDIDCVAAPGTCSLNAIDYNDFTISTSAPLDFDPNAPPLPGPTATVTPSTGLVDGQTVDVQADGMPPGANVFVVQCKAGSTDSGSCDLSNLQSPPLVDDNGHVTGTINVKRVLTLFGEVPPPPISAEPVTGRMPKSAAAFQPRAESPTPFDCASAPGACTVAVVFLGQQIEAATAALDFDPNVPPNETTVPGEPATTVPGGSGSTTPGPATTAAAAAATSSTTGSSGSTQPLPRTGAAIMPLLSRVALLLALGGVLVFAARVRRRRLSAT